MAPRAGLHYIHGKMSPSALNRTSQRNALRFKTRVLNRVRALMVATPIEAQLASRTQGKRPSDVLCRFIPPNYLFPIPSRRVVSRGGLRLDLDVSNYVDHVAYFGLNDDNHHLFFERLTPTMTVLDVGANIGYFALRVAQLVDKGRVVGFEPDPDNFRSAQRNLSLNSLQNLEVLNIGLSDRDGDGALFRLDENNTGTNSLVASGHPSSLGKPSANIVLRTLDRIVREKAFTNVDAIKIDVEGHELNVLRGAQDTLKRFRPLMLVEVSPTTLNQQGQTPDGLIQVIRDFGYRIIDVDTGHSVEGLLGPECRQFDALCLPN